MFRHILTSLKKCVEGAISHPALNPFFNGPTIHPSSTVSMSNNVPANVLAFRTVTSLLAHLPQTTPIKSTDNLENERWESPETRQELKISDAFAQLAVSQHDVVAVSTIRGSSLDLITCATQDMAENDENADRHNTESSGLVDRVVEVVQKGWHLLITRNDRSADTSTSSGTPYPTTITPVEPDNLNGRTAYDYMLSLEEHWIKPTLPTHLWILSKVLMEGAEHCGQQDFRTRLSKHLFRYTAAMSCKKIKRRFTNPHLSRPFIESLQKVTDIPIPSKSRRISASTGNTRHDHEETLNDRLLLQDFVKLTKKYDRILNTPIPNLLYLAYNIPESRTPGFTIYNDDTFMEFHQLLLQLLARFETALEHLSVLDEKTENFSERFKKSMADSQLYGYALLRLARGQAFRKHIQNIGPFLKDYHRTNVGAPMPAPNAEDHEALDEEDSDEELKAIQPANYVGWLRLVVAHFDAVEIVLSYVTSSKFFHKSIAVKILVAPSTSGALYPWRELLTHPEYFPTKDQDPASTSTTTNAEILQFLETAVSAASKAKDFSAWATTARDGWTNRTSTSFKYQQVCWAINNLANSNNPAVKKIAGDTYAALQTWQNIKDDLEVANLKEIVITKKIETLYDMVHPLPAGNTFFRNLDNQRFKGAMHCEACLASLLDNVTKHVQPGSKYDEIPILSEMKGYGRVIGVSKRCCPVCYHFLSQLTKWAGGQPFVIRGSHSVISACTLPPWTPSEVVDSMIQIFGAILRRDLIALKENMATSNGFNRNRSQSTGSETLSIDSSESWGENISQNLADSVEDSSYNTSEVQL